jgi:nucleotide-binding universal stress UspA family protein
MYIRILVPLDGSRLSEQVIPYVLPMAEKLKAHVQLFRVIGPVDPSLADPAHGRFLDQISTSMRNQAEDSLGIIRSAFTEAGI